MSPPPLALPLSKVLSVLKKLYFGIDRKASEVFSFKNVSCTTNTSSSDRVNKINKSSQLRCKLRIFWDQKVMPLRPAKPTGILVGLAGLKGITF